MVLLLPFVWNKQIMDTSILKMCYTISYKTSKTYLFGGIFE